jgi:hypothetical protein
MKKEGEKGGEKRERRGTSGNQGSISPTFYRQLLRT